MYEKLYFENFVKNSDITKYGVIQNHDKLIYLNWLTKPSDYPKTINHLSKFKTILADQVKRFNESYPWFALHRPREKSIFESTNKILVPYRSKSNIFGYTDTATYSSRDVLHINEKPNGVRLLFILGILNSKLMLVWLMNKGKRKGETLELVYTPLSEIPIKIPEDNEQILLEDLVKEIINLKRSNPNINTSALESKIDKIVYSLYELSEEEIKLVEELTK